MDDSKLREIQSALENAENFINQKKPDLAIESLNGIKDDIELYPNTVELMKFFLLLGEALSAKRNPLAQDYLREADKKSAPFELLYPELRIRCLEHLGDFYERSRNFALAMSAFKRAEEIGVEQHREHARDRVQLKIIHVDLKKKDHVELENFLTLWKICKDKAFTWSEQLMAWRLHLGIVRELKQGNSIC